jgi:hypothetical protein
MKLEQIRAAIEAKTDELDQVRDAQRPVDEGVATVAAAFDHLVDASPGAELLAGVLAADGGERPFTLTPLLQVTTNPPTEGGALTCSLFGLEENLAAVQAVLILTGRKAIEANARAFLERRAGNAPAMTAAQRVAALKRLKTELLDLERQEEAAILKLEAGGEFVPRRSEADPAVILRVWKEEL